MQTDSHNSVIAQAVERQVIPWVTHWGMQRIFTAFHSYNDWRQADLPLPEGSSVTYRALKSKRVRREAHSQELIPGVEAVWPEDRMWSVKKPRLCFILSGAVAFQIADYVFHCKPGHGILLPAGVAFPDGSHSCFDESLLAERQREILAITPISCWISRRFVDEQGVVRRSADNSGYPRSPIAEYLGQLTEEAVRRDFNSEAVCSGLLTVIANILSRELRTHAIYKTGVLSEVEHLSLSSDSQSAIKRAQKYIIRHLRHSPRLTEVAQYVYMSKTTFTEQFRKETGMSFSEFLNQSRVAEAKELLSGTQLRVEGISQLLGISPRRLRILFQEQTGLSPADYRKQMRRQK